MATVCRRALRDMQKCPRLDVAVSHVTVIKFVSVAPLPVLFAGDAAPESCRPASSPSPAPRVLEPAGAPGPAAPVPAAPPPAVSLCGAALRVARMHTGFVYSTRASRCFGTATTPARGAAVPRRAFPRRRPLPVPPWRRAAASRAARSHSAPPPPAPAPALSPLPCIGPAGCSRRGHTAQSSIFARTASTPVLASVLAPTP